MEGAIERARRRWSQQRSAMICIVGAGKGGATANQMHCRLLVDIIFNGTQRHAHNGQPNQVHRLEVHIDGAQATHRHNGHKAEAI